MSGEIEMDKGRKKMDPLESTKALIRLFFFTRYSFLFGTLLIGLAFLPWIFPFPAVYSVYIMDRFARVFTITVISVLAAALVVQTFRVTICNAKGRFDDEPVNRYWDDPPEWLWRLRSFSVWLIGLPLPIACVIVTLSSNAANRGETNLLETAWPWFALMVGTVTAALFLSLLDVLNRKILTPNLHDPRLFVLDHRFLFGLRESPRKWKRNKDNAEARGNPLGKARRQRWKWRIASMKKLHLTHGYIHEIDVWMKPDDGESDQPRLEKLETLLPGHVMLSLMTLFLVLVYVASYFLVRHWGMLPDEDRAYGTLFYLVGLIMLVCGGLPSLAFYFDRYRISPTLVVALVFGFVSILWPGSAAHQFETAPSPHYLAGTPATAGSSDDAAGTDAEIEKVVDHTFLNEPIEVKDVVDGWQLRQQAIADHLGTAPNRTFVVITATGGGIQASSWTSKVLTGLHESQASSGATQAEKNFAHQFTGSIGLISSVSGGSVGTLQYIAKYPELTRCNAKQSERVLADVHELASRSSLEAVGWGLFFPDTLRAIGVNRNATYDRGSVQEQLWGMRMRIPSLQQRQWKPVDTSTLNIDAAVPEGAAPRDDWRLGHLAFRVKAGTMPAVVFNSYAVNTGQRVMIAPFTFRDRDQADKKLRNTFEGVEYADFMGMQTRLSTAARLSATFPYISPTAVSDRPILEEELDKRGEISRSEIVLRECHFADGGFTDNEGLLAALQFIERLRFEYDRKPLAERPFDQILLIRIVPFPSTSPATDIELGKIANLSRDANWKQALIGPAIAMFNGRSVAQQERGAIDIENLSFLMRKPENQESSNPETSSTDDVPGQANAMVQQMQYRNSVLTGKSMDLPKPSLETHNAIPIRFNYVAAGFRYPEGETRSPPLSWKLSGSEKQDIDQSWDDWCQAVDEDETNLQRVYRLLRSK